MRTPRQEPVYRKKFVIKFVTSKMLKDAVAGEYSRYGEDMIEEEDYFEYTFENGTIVKIPLNKSIYWVFYRDPDGKYLPDSYGAEDTAPGRKAVVVYKEFADHMNLKAEVWYVSREKGMEKIK